MRSENLTNSLRNALRPGYARVMGRKAIQRIAWRDRSGAASSAWARTVSVRAFELCAAIDRGLWDEAAEFAATAKQRAGDLSTKLGVEVGYGARADLAYFVTRLHRPEVAVETGVAFGYSSYAILAAMAANGTGHLYSSDFPFFRQHDPERVVGTMVPDELRERWTLHLRGDDHNLPVIVGAIGDTPIDVFHYDSDKSYAGRRRALDLLTPHLAPTAVVLMDDIEDNTFFRDHVLEHAPDDFTVFGPGPHFVGAIGLPRAS